MWTCTSSSWSRRHAVSLQHLDPAPCRGAEQGGPQKNQSLRLEWSHNMRGELPTHKFLQPKSSRVWVRIRSIQKMYCLPLKLRFTLVNHPYPLQTWCRIYLMIAIKCHFLSRLRENPIFSNKQQWFHFPLNQFSWSLNFCSYVRIWTVIHTIGTHDWNHYFQLSSLNHFKHGQPLNEINQSA